MDSFELNVRRETSRFGQNGKKYYLGGFDFKIVGYSYWTFEKLCKAFCDEYAWGSDDDVEIQYYDKVENKFVQVSSDAELTLMFVKNMEDRSIILQNEVVIRTRAQCNPNHPVTANTSVQSQASCNKSQPSSTTSEHVRSQASDSTVQDVIVEESLPDQFVSCDNDERLYADLVDRTNIEGCDELIAQFQETDDEEKEENNEMGLGELVGDEDLPVIHYDKDNPSLDEGSTFPSMDDCRIALATYCIRGEFDFVIDKSEPGRLTVHCAYNRCRWRMHASPMRNSTIIQVKVNPFPHTCPSAERKASVKVAKSRWCADVMLNWVRENPCIGTAALVRKIYETYGIQVPYMRVFYGKEMALDRINGPWKDSFKLVYTFKAEVEKACPASVVEIDRHTVQYKVKGKTMEKECFRRVFVCFKACWKGFLDGCRPYLAVDATALNGRFRGQLVAATAIDAHNWLFPVAYGVLEAESTESWKWFLQNLRHMIGFPNGLVIHTDACKGLEIAVDQVFPGVEHRECMRHLVANFGKLFKGKLYDDNLWPSSLTYSSKKHMYHLRQMFTKQEVKDFLEKDHPKIWARSKFNEICKVDYVNNNLAESFNAWIRKVKGLNLVDMLDKIRQMLMAKFSLRQKIAAEKFVGHKIIPAVMKPLHAKTRSLKMTLIKRKPYEAEVTAIDKENREWRYPVDLEKRTCSCKHWQITGLPCIHALFFITSLRGPAAEIDQYVHEYYSVAKFNATYAENVPSMEGKQQWEVVNPGFVLHAPLQGRAPGRPKKTRIRSSAEGRSGLGPRKRRCKRCGGSGHIARTCKNAVDASFGEDDHWGAENAQEPPAEREAEPPAEREADPQTVPSSVTCVAG